MKKEFKPLNREQFGMTRLQDFYEHHGFEYCPVTSCWTDIDTKLGLNINDPAEVQYKQYVEIMKVWGTPLWKALK